MEITKYKIKILKYLNRRPNGTAYSVLNSKFGKSYIQDLIHAKYITHNFEFPTDPNGFPIGDISDNTLCFITDSGKAIVENQQWFNGQFVLTQILLPIVIAIITTLLTLFLSSWL